MEELRVISGLNIEFDLEVYQDDPPVTRLPLVEYNIIIWTRRGDNRAVTQWSSEDQPAKVVVEPGAVAGLVQVRLTAADSASLRTGELRILAQRKDNANDISPIADDVALVVED